MAGAHDAFDDAVLGHVTFDVQGNQWRFTVRIDGREVRGSIDPIDSGRPVPEEALKEIRQCVGWVRDNEPAIRDYITDQMFDGWLSGWYDEEIDTVTTREGFRDAIHLPALMVAEEDRAATLFYDDGGLFGGHCIGITVAAGGHYTQPPQIWG